MARRDEQSNHPEDWNAELGRTGSVPFQLSTRRLRWVSVGGVVFLLAGIAVAVTGESTSDRIAGAFAALIGVGSVVACILQLRQKGPAVVVDSRGVTAHYLRHGERLVPWAEILDTGVFRVRGTAMVLLVISSEFESRWLSDHRAGRASRALAVANRRLVGAPSIALPSPLRLDPDELAEWIARKAEERRDG